MLTISAVASVIRHPRRKLSGSRAVLESGVPVLLTVRALSEFRLESGPVAARRPFVPFVPLSRIAATPLSPALALALGEASESGSGPEPGGARPGPPRGG